MPFADEVAQPASGHNVGIFRIVHTAAPAGHEAAAQPQIELAPAARGAHRNAAHTDVLADGSAAQARDRLADESLADEFRRAELHARIDRERARVEQRIAGNGVEPTQPPDVATEGDLTRVIRRPPAEPHAPFEIRPPGAFTGIRLGRVGSLNRTRNRRKHSALDRQAQRDAVLCGHTQLRQPEPEITGGAEGRRAYAGPPARVSIPDEPRLPS